MRLAQPFIRLPVRFDAEEMRAQVSSLAPAAWQAHPNHIAGNSCVRLISVDGTENDQVYGPMAPTVHLQQLPYVQQILASFGVVWSRSRLMRLDAGAVVPEHADINHHWFYRVRLHIPIVTNPQVTFYCGNQDAHMAAGESWLFDNWRLHRVENLGDAERIHLVADTTGSAKFWQFVASANTPGSTVYTQGYDATRSRKLRVERAAPAAVMPPAELDLLSADLCRELELDTVPAAHRERGLQFVSLMGALQSDWRQAYASYAMPQDGMSEFRKLRDGIRAALPRFAAGLTMRTNRVAASAVFEGRIGRALLPFDRDESDSLRRSSGRPRSDAAQFKAPIIILSAPRSGSTLLFETLALSNQIATIGGESHEIIEDIPALRPDATGVTSNRLRAEHASDEVGTRIREGFAARLVDSSGRAVRDPSALRLLEKTPKNTLRVPFLNAVFPDARFVLLWRDPQQALGSIIRAWQSGRWKTYSGLPGFSRPWSLLLPPGWPDYENRSLADIAAFQWIAANQYALDDLSALEPDRWMSISYSELLRAPLGAVQRIFQFAELKQPDAALVERLAKPLPLSRQTLTAPSAEKWRDLETEILEVLPAVLPVWERLRNLDR